MKGMGPASVSSGSSFSLCGAPLSEVFSVEGLQANWGDCDELPSKAGELDGDHWLPESESESLSADVVAIFDLLLHAANNRKRMV